MVDLNYTINPGAMLMPADRLLISGAVSLATNTAMLLTVAMLLATDIGIMGDCPLFLRSIGPKIHWSEKPLGGKPVSTLNNSNTISRDSLTLYSIKYLGITTYVL